MRISNAFPSKYLKAADLNGKEFTLTISHCELEDIGGDDNSRNKETKPVLYFQGAQKGMVLNKTNAGVLQHAYGDETEGWAGCKLILYEDLVRFQGQMVPALRIRVPRQRAGSVSGKHPAPQRPAPAVDRTEDDNSYASAKAGGGDDRRFEREVDDEIPF